MTTPVPMFGDDDLSAIKSFADAMALLNQANVSVISTEDLGTGFTVLDDKDRLLKVPFVILDSVLNRGENGVFVSLYVVTDRNEKLIVNDGSTGIRDQVCRYYERLNKVGLNADNIGDHLLKGVMVKGGLTRSDYHRKDDKGELMYNDAGDPLRGTTYYLS